MTITTQSLTYKPNTAQLLTSLQPLGGLVALESMAGDHENGEWSIISAAPLETIRLYANEADQAKTKIEELLHTYQPKVLTKSFDDLPFTGGVLGALSYDSGSSHLKFKPSGFKHHPTLVVGYYHWAFLLNHRTQKALLIYDNLHKDQPPKDLVNLYEGSDMKSETAKYSSGKFKSNIVKKTYGESFSCVKNYIQSGDVYQINLTQSFTAKHIGNPLDAYLKIKSNSVSPLLTYMDLTPDLSLASASPELFLNIDKDNKVKTKPIKGTLPRSKNKTQDKDNIQQLKSSEKDRAENLMIVDLLRNDLSIDCHNVSVPKLFDIESFELVHHLVSSIEGDLDESSNQTKAFINAFPGGSITGAPKRRAMEIIEELEHGPRSFYCGSAFLFSINNKHQSNILIRTFIFEKDKVTCWAGGGIVADSKCDAEYQESLDKISRLMEVLED